MYYDFSEALRDIPSHRMLAMRRGEKEETLRLQVDAPEDQIMATLYQLLIPVDHPFSHWLQQVSGDAYQRLLAPPSIEVELRLQAKKKKLMMMLFRFLPKIYEICSLLLPLGVDVSSELIRA